MQMRYDLLICYGAIGVALLLSLIFTIPTFVQAIIIPPIIIYLGAHQAAQTTCEPNQSTKTQANRGDFYMFPIMATMSLFGLFVFFQIFPYGFISLLFNTFALVVSTWILSQRINMILVGLTNEEQEQNIRGHRCNVPLQPVNQSIRPAIVAINSTISSTKAAFAPISPYFQYVTQIFTSFHIYIIEKVDGKDAAQVAAANTNNTNDTALLPPYPTSHGVQITQSNNIDDWFPELVVLDGASAFSFSLAIFIAFLYSITRFSLFHNIYAISISLSAIELINLGSMMNAITFAGGLLVYDLFWFFGSTTTTSSVSQTIPFIPLDVYFPHTTLPTMLGIANIILPALVISLFLRFDMVNVKPFNHRDANTTPVNLLVNRLGALSFITISTDYFNLSLMGYTFGVALNGIVFTLTQTPQPSLVYIIPLIFGITFCFAAVFWKDEYQPLLNFVDNPDDNDSQPRLSVASPAFSLKSE